MRLRCPELGRSNAPSSRRPSREGRDADGRGAQSRLLLYLPIESRAIHLARLQSHHLWGRNCWDSSATERGYELVLSWAAASFGGIAVGTAIRRRGALWGSSGTDSATRAPKESDLLSPSSCGEKAIEGEAKRPREDIALYCIIPNRRLFKPTCSVYPSPWHMWSG